MNIRTICPDDRDIFMEMVREFYASPAVSSDVDFSNFETTFQLSIENSPFLRTLMLEDGGEPVGYGLLSFTYSNEVGGMVVLMEELYIRAAFRGLGHAHSFFAFVEREYPAAKRFRLEVRADNVGAISLYRRLGYGDIPYAQMCRDRI